MLTPRECLLSLFCSQIKHRCFYGIGACRFIFAWCKLLLLQIDADVVLVESPCSVAEEAEEGEEEEDTAYDVKRACSGEAGVDDGSAVLIAVVGCYDLRFALFEGGGSRAGADSTSVDSDGGFGVAAFNCYGLCARAKERAGCGGEAEEDYSACFDDGIHRLL